MFRACSIFIALQITKKKEIEMEEKIRIYVATHKKAEFPKESIYYPIRVGSALSEDDFGYIRDDTGENISNKNKNYCELTALYWMWKNVSNCEYIGLNHYRRYFSKKGDNIFCKDKLDLVLTEKEVKEILEKYDFIVSNSQKLLIKNVYEKYKEQHHINDLDECRNIISEKYPEYLKDFDEIMNGKEICICNMFIAKKQIIDEYSKWLFDILFELENRIDISDYTTLQKRVYGFLSERLFNVWLKHNKKLKITHLPILKLEHDSIKTIIKKSYRRVMKIKS